MNAYPPSLLLLTTGSCLTHGGYLEDCWSLVPRLCHCTNSLGIECRRLNLVKQLGSSRSVGEIFEGLLCVQHGLGDETVQTRETLPFWKMVCDRLLRQVSHCQQQDSQIVPKSCNNSLFNKCGLSAYECQAPCQTRGCPEMNHTFYEGHVELPGLPLSGGPQTDPPGKSLTFPKNSQYNWNSWISLTLVLKLKKKKKK